MKSSNTIGQEDIEKAQVIAWNMNRWKNVLPVSVLWKDHFSSDKQ
jgi:hypothetical protein